MHLHAHRHISSHVTAYTGINVSHNGDLLYYLRSTLIFLFCSVHFLKTLVPMHWIYFRVWWDLHIKTSSIDCFFKFRDTIDLQESRTIVSDTFCGPTPDLLNHLLPKPDSSEGSDAAEFHRLERKKTRSEPRMLRIPLKGNWKSSFHLQFSTVVLKKRRWKYRLF